MRHIIIEIIIKIGDGCAGAALLLVARCSANGELMSAPPFEKKLCGGTCIHAGGIGGRLWE
jgi:hypothetical protein